MAKICINGIVREMTAEEIEGMEIINAQIPNTSSKEQELEARIASLEAALNLLLN